MKNKILKTTLALTVSLLTSELYAAVSASDAARLDKDLTPFGAVREASADGLIPAWDGGLTSAVPNSNSKLPPKLFEDEKPILSIEKGNMSQYSDKLTDGVRYMLEKYPGFKLEVYQSRRTAAAPQYVYDRTKKNAEVMELDVATQQANFDKYAGGVPFPIPKNGDEAILNTQRNWRGPQSTSTQATWLVTANGRKTKTNANLLQVVSLYDQPGDNSNIPFNGGLWMTSIISSVYPPYSAGEKMLTHIPLQINGTKVNAWTYLQGQRRLRKSPNVQYDVPNNFTSGLINFDDSWGFGGATDRYNWTLIGREERYVPYNGNNMAYVPVDSLLGEKFVNPQYLRWELHRVWVVEGNLKTGMRHVVPKRRFYIDEDTWSIVATDQWDAKGKLWKTHMMPHYVFPQVPATLLVPQIVYNLQAGDYGVMGVIDEGSEINFNKLSDSMYTPQYLERSGVR